MISFLMIALLYTSVLYAQVQPTSVDKLKLEQKVKENLKENGETIRFLENKGQLENKDVLYYFEGIKGSVYIERGRIRFVANDDTLITKPVVAGLPFPAYSTETTRAVKATHTFSVYLQGANMNPKINLGESFSTKYNYILGQDPKGWVSGVQAAKDLTLEDIYDGINLRLYSTADGVMEFDWIMDAGADYRKVNLKFEGQDRLEIGKDGSLNVDLRFTNVNFHIPESYQVTEHGKVPVDFAFHRWNGNTINFTTKSTIDSDYPLIIDPTLTWGTFMDGANSNFDAYLYAIQVDPDDEIVYCAGGTNRPIPTNAAPYDADGYVNNITGLTGSTGNPATPTVAVVYRISSDGSDLIDLTLYGPASVSGSNFVVAQALSLSATNVFVGGYTNVAVPTTGSPFDATLNSGDGFVAVFPRDLGSLTYATFLGSTGNENIGVTSIRAISDNSFVVGLTAVAALPAGYVSGGAADGTFAGSEMYIAKFTSFNTLSWGTYVGGPNAETFNDLEVFGDGRVAFADPEQVPLRKSMVLLPLPVQRVRQILTE